MRAFFILLGIVAACLPACARAQPYVPRDVTNRPSPISAGPRWTPDMWTDWDAHKASTTNGVLTNPTIDTATVKGGLFMNRAYVSARQQGAVQDCPGNNGPDNNSLGAGSNGGAKGVECIVGKSGANSRGSWQTYFVQHIMDVPAYSQSIDPAFPRTGGTVNTHNDQVTAYDQISLGAFSAAGWVYNGVLDVGHDGGIGIFNEADIGNHRGCDNTPPNDEVRTTGGSRGFVSKRSDGSPCPVEMGFDIVGTGSNISQKAIVVSSLTDGGVAGFQVGLSFEGLATANSGSAVNYADLYTFDSSQILWRVYGTHTEGLDFQRGTFRHAIKLGSNDAGDGIYWYPNKGGTGWPVASIQPSADGYMHLLGPQWTADTGFRSQTFTTETPSGAFHTDNLSPLAPGDTLMLHGSVRTGSMDTVTIPHVLNVGTLVDDPGGVAPAHANSSCTKGQRAWDATYEYRCVAPAAVVKWQRWARNPSDTW